MPTSKIDLVLNFFKDTKKSAQLLNKIYKYGLRHLNEEEVTWDYRQAIIRICEYLENVEDTEARSSRANIIQLLTHMHPDLVAALFEQATSDKKNTGLGKAIIDHFHDTEVAEFLSLLVAGEGCVNEFLVRIFDKLAPGEEEAKELTPLTADLLFSRNDMHPVNLSSLQQSVREIFRKHPHNSFINQMYKITVDSVLKKDLGGLTYLPNLAPEIHRFTQFMTSRVIREERVRLLVNLLWLEEDGNDYRRLSEKLLELLPDLIAAKQLEAIRTIYEFYFKKMPSKQEAVEEVRILVQKIHQRLSDDKLVTHLVQLIPEVPEGLPFFGGILKYVDDTAARILVDAYQNDTNKVHRERYVRVLPSLSSSILVELEAKLADRDPGNISLFVPILQQLHPDQAHATVKRLLNSRNSQVVYSVIDRFQPRDRDEIHDVYRIFIKTKDRVIKKKAAAVLLKTGEKETVGRVFAHAGEFRRRKLLFAVVQLCGELKSKQAFGLLVQILMKRSFLPSRKRDNLRLAAARSLMLIEWEKGYKIVSSRMKSGSRYFKDHCQKMIKQQLGQESKNGDRN